MKEKENYYNKLYLKDTGTKGIIKLNDNDITNGIYKYVISRNSFENNTIDLELHMTVLIEDVEIDTEKVNLK